MSVWSFVLSKNLFYCSDPIPLVDFIPPFVHKTAPGNYIIINGDYFLVDEKIV